MAPVFHTEPCYCCESCGRGLPFDFARHDDGVSVCFAMPNERRIGVRNMAIPVVSGVGRIVGELTNEEIGKNANVMTSADVQKFRDALDRRGGSGQVAVHGTYAGAC